MPWPTGLSIRSLDMDEKFSHLTLTVAAANFVISFAPSGGMGGIAVLVSEARRKGISRRELRLPWGDHTFGLYWLYDHARPRNNRLIRRSTLSSTEVVASAVMVVLALVPRVIIIYWDALSNMH